MKHETASNQTPWLLKKRLRDPSCGLANGSFAGLTTSGRYCFRELLLRRLEEPWWFDRGSFPEGTFSGNTRVAQLIGGGQMSCDLAKVRSGIVKIARSFAQSERNQE